MHQVALLIALGTTGGLFNSRPAQSSCAGGSCAAPAYTYSRHYAPAPAYRAPAVAYRPAAPAPAMVQQPAPAPVARPVYQTAQAPAYTYSRYYAPAGTSCPTGTCPYTR
jgi:hypothetical protein